MSTLFVKIVKIQSIEPHPNADKLEVAKIAGWECVVKKGQFNEGDLAVYVPVDSRLPYELEERLFKDSKVKLDHGRIKTIRLRKKISQGLLIDLGSVPEINNPREDLDVQDILKITKYEPPEPSEVGFGPKGARKQRKRTEGFIRYTDIQNIKWYNRCFKEEDIVWISEKLHGTSARYLLNARNPKTIWEKVKKFFGKNLGLEVVCGTRETEHSADDPSSVWAKIARQYCLSTKLKQKEILFGEIVGNNIQKGYSYGFAPGEHGLFVYDVYLMNEKRFLNYEELVAFCKERELDMVPVLYVGPFSEKIVKECTVGASVLDPNNPIREGSVVKPVIENTGPSSNRKVLKSINDEYALKDNTEFH